MIEAIITFSGQLVDKPTTKSLFLYEDELAMEKKNETTQKYEKFTVGQLFDLWHLQSQYILDSSDPNDVVSADHFLAWFHAKYMNGSFSSRVLDIKFKKI